MNRLSEAQIAYLAGLIDGEGSLECQRQMQPSGRTPRFVLRLSFVFATEEPLRTISGWLGVQPKRYATHDARRSDRWRMHIPKGIAYGLIARCLPHLIQKRRQAELLLAIEDVRAAASPTKRHVGRNRFQAVPQTAVDRMEVLHRELRSLKSNKRRMPPAA